MTCEKCQIAQDLYREGSGGSYPYRLDRATILIIACGEHATKAIKMLRSIVQ